MIGVQAERPAESRVELMAKMLVMVRFFGEWGHAAARRPLTSAPRAGRSGMRRRMVGSTIQRPRVINVDRALEAIQLDDDGQADRGLPCRDGDDEDREDLAFQRRKMARESDHVDVDL